MTPPPETGFLRGYRVMLVEDEWLIALEMKGLLEQWGGIVLGPVATVARALALLDQSGPDAAVLDLNLKGEYAKPVAAALSAKGVPFLILTSYGRNQVTSPELQNVPHLSKPINEAQLFRALGEIVG